MKALFKLRRAGEIAKSYGQHAAKTGDPASRTVAQLVREHDDETRRRETAAEQTQPLHPVYLSRCGDPEVVHAILGARGIVERVVEDFAPERCEWCEYVPVGLTCVRMSIRHADAAGAECCGKPECFHAALRWVDRQEPSGDFDVLVEIARRPAVRL